ncbi:GTP-binding protein rad [Plakobranchus ocellatus]|uniref:small monomeric GTPase n=1 Tax=Plakobranchus ocellatus TaxID=259542 RepID=A0AAV3Z4B2_9GAST|nr:GTP-binding protein rad [Plakobranchus ocellatus]
MAAFRPFCGFLFQLVPSSSSLTSLPQRPNGSRVYLVLCPFPPDIYLFYVYTVTDRAAILCRLQDECQPSCHDVYDADAFIVVYSITDARTFKVAQDELGRIRSGTTASAPILLLGNKLDFDHVRKVPLEHGRKAAETASCLHVEVSAAESHAPIIDKLHSLFLDAVTSLCHRGRTVKRRKSLFENVSKKLGSVFRMRSLEDAGTAAAEINKQKMMQVCNLSSNRSVHDDDGDDNDDEYDESVHDDDGDDNDDEYDDNVHDDEGDKKEKKLIDTEMNSTGKTNDWNKRNTNERWASDLQEGEVLELRPRPYFTHLPKHCVLEAKQKGSIDLR